MVEMFGPGGVSWALLILGIVEDMPVFFEVGLVLLMSIVMAAARQSGRPPILVGIPLLAGLWGWFRRIRQPCWPHHFLGTDRGDSRRSGCRAASGVGAYAAVAAENSPARSQCNWRRAHALPGPRIRTWGTRRPRNGVVRTCSRASWAQAGFAILLPIALIFLGSWPEALAAPGSVFNRLLQVVGSPDIALLIAVLAGLVVLGPRIQDGRLPVMMSRNYFLECL